ncbi:essential MCU regulator, mitochondrial-like [Tachyglossus aculeatus]|uniref:essential MCU regulator, mitochondrial-like n=1 Tax=Tachyglossus aculeatus TaxID=9261 RepID=UPI0018F6323C|nr:essential MCU regulator, mitochondrial-like [Tachyglossus aculeatus]
MAAGACRWLMAAVPALPGPLGNRLRLGSGGAARGTARSGPAPAQGPSRTLIVTQSGAILPKPAKMSFGLLRVFSIVIPFLYIGTLISKNFAALLEKHDIFVPEDDDD